MPAPNSLCKTILRNARDAQGSTPGSALGLAVIKSYRSGIANVLTSAGRIMVNSSGGGKAYSFANGYKVEEFVSAVDEAESIWIAYEAAQIALLLDTPPIKTTQAMFGSSTRNRSNC